MSLPAPISDIDRAIAIADGDPAKLRALEELAEAAKRYATSHEQRVAASVAKLRIARAGGRSLIGMAERGERARAGSADGSGREPSVPTLDDLGLSKQRSSRWQAIGRLGEDEFARREQAILDADPDDELGKGAHVGANSGENEWYTPAAIIESARKVMGGIDLDPASTEVANEVVKATTFYTAADDGLTQGWRGKVWLNPPYARPLIDRFAEKLAEEYANENIEQAVVLVNNATDTSWFGQMAHVASAVCFTSKRVRFWHPERESAPLQGQAILYFGPDVQSFVDEFKAHGHTWVAF